MEPNFKTFLSDLEKSACCPNQVTYDTEPCDMECDGCENKNSMVARARDLVILKMKHVKLVEELQNLKHDYSTLDEPSRTRCLELIEKIGGVQK